MRVEGGEHTADGHSEVADLLPVAHLPRSRWSAVDALIEHTVRLARILRGKLEPHCSCGVRRGGNVVACVAYLRCYKGSCLPRYGRR